MDVAQQLPKKTEQVLFCRLTSDQRDLYRSYISSQEVADILNVRRVSFSPLFPLHLVHFRLLSFLVFFSWFLSFFLPSFLPLFTTFRASSAFLGPFGPFCCYFATFWVFLLLFWVAATCPLPCTHRKVRHVHTTLRMLARVLAMDCVTGGGKIVAIASTPYKGNPLPFFILGLRR